MENLIDATPLNFKQIFICDAILHKHIHEIVGNASSTQGIIENHTASDPAATSNSKVSFLINWSKQDVFLLGTLVGAILGAGLCYYYYIKVKEKKEMENRNNIILLNESNAVNP